MTNNKNISIDVTVSITRGGNFPPDSLGESRQVHKGTMTQEAIFDLTKQLAVQCADAACLQALRSMMTAPEEVEVEGD